MGYKGYYEGKEERAKKARTHTALMARKYEKRIRNSTNRTVVYGGEQIMPMYVGYPEEIPTPEISVVDTDSVSAIFDHKDRITAVLNFASYKNPGGMFINGSSAQEESLCHESNLYNILYAFEDTYYKWNRKNVNHSLYTNRALYTPDVMFIREGLEPVRCDVITCASPNWSSAKSYHHEPKVNNRRALYSRIKFVKMIAEENHVDTLILGAFGCGVFGQNPVEVAKFFADVFEHSVVKRLVFAIPSGFNTENYEAFVNQFCKKEETEM